MDKYEKIALFLTGGILILFLFATLWSSQGAQTDIPECIPYDAIYEEPKISQIDSTTFQIFCVAKMWSFEPNEIFLPVGSEVDIFLTSKDVVHGFHIFEKNVNLMAVYGGVSKTTVTFDKPGIYKIVCHEYCGFGHEQMEAEIIVNYSQGSL